MGNSQSEIYAAERMLDLIHCFEINEINLEMVNDTVHVIIIEGQKYNGNLRTPILITLYLTFSGHG